MNGQEPLALEYFSGGVPAGADFWDVLEDIHTVSAQFAKPERGIQRLQEICFVGSLSYFEAFCKDHLASLINIEPSLVERLREAGQDVQTKRKRILACWVIATYLCIMAVPTRHLTS